MAASWFPTTIISKNRLGRASRSASSLRIREQARNLTLLLFGPFLSRLARARWKFLNWLFRFAGISGPATNVSERPQATGTSSFVNCVYRMIGIRHAGTGNARIILDSLRPGKPATLPGSLGCSTSSPVTCLTLFASVPYSPSPDGPSRVLSAVYCRH
jgi:hypothetical protein